MKKKVVRSIDLRFVSCKTCGEVTILMTARSKGLTGFIKHGCFHSVKLLMMEMLKEKIAKRKALRLAANPKGGKRKKAT